MSAVFGFIQELILLELEASVLVGIQLEIDAILLCLSLGRRGKTSKPDSRFWSPAWAAERKS